MPANIEFGNPIAGFDQPVALWEACHERVLRMNELLIRLIGHVREHGADESARVTATSIRRYFDDASPRHHEDEENDLFPRLLARASGKPGSVAAERIASAIATLKAEHQEIARLWSSIRNMMQQVENGSAAELDDASIALFVSHYRTHLAVEEDVIGPALKRMLTAKDLGQIGAAMAKRRGVAWTPAGATAPESEAAKH